MARNRWYVISTPCFPNSWKLVNDHCRPDNSTCNYFPTSKEAWDIANARNERIVAEEAKNDRL